MNRLTKILIVIFIVFTSSISQVVAQINYPSPTSDYVNDFANIIHEADKKILLKRLDQVETQTGIEIVVVTINSMADYSDTTANLESFATGLYNYWGVGHKETNKGAMILVAKQDRKVRIELGLGYPSRFDNQMQEIIDEKMLPFLRTGDYSRAIYEGTTGVVSKLTKEVSWFSYYMWEIILTIVALLCIAAGISCINSGKKGWGWTFFTIAGIILLAVITMASKSKKRNGFGGGRSGGGGASGSW